MFPDPLKVPSRGAGRKKTDRTSAPLSRRGFLCLTGSALGGWGLLGCSGLRLSMLGTGRDEVPIRPCGPASRYTPTVKAAFVRRKGDYGILWPGAIYDGEKARRQYTAALRQAAEKLRVRLELEPEPLYSAEEADRWLAEAKASRPDGLFVVLLDRQRHAWPTAGKAVESRIPTVVFAPVGTAFTTNTARHADQTGVFIASTDDFAHAAFGLRMLAVGARLRETRCIVLKGQNRRDSAIHGLGMKLRYVPARDFLDEYNRTPTDERIRRIAAEYLRGAERVFGATEQDVLNGVKSYEVARRILEREEGDAITMDCLGALGGTKVSLPCISWSRMLDAGIPAACEADLGAAVTHALILYLFERPGFQQDPVPETARGCLIGAHCSCPTRLNGLDRPREPYYLSHHHGMRDAVPRTIWRKGQRITIADMLLSEKPEEPHQMVIGTGTVVDNVSVPPSGGCVVSVLVRPDGQTNVLSYPGFHQLFFYGDYRNELLAYCKLYGIRPVVA